MKKLDAAKAKLDQAQKEYAEVLKEHKGVLAKDAGGGRFFCFDQNNTGGSFVQNADLDHFVIIEARDAEAANAKAETLGIYFNGCSTGDDCSCCGDRWYSAYGEGDSEPRIYGKLVEEWALESKYNYWNNAAIIYYADGRKLRVVQSKSK